MNFGIKEISTTTTIKTITNNTATTTTPTTATTTIDSSTREVTATITELTAAPFLTNLNSNNYTTNLPKSFTTPQNCLEILTSIQNKSVSCDTATTSNSSSLAKSTFPSSSSSSLSSTSNATIAPTEAFTSVQTFNNESSLNSYMDGNEENNDEINICYHLERKKSLPDLKKNINATVPDSCTNIENSTLTTQSSISNSITDTVNILKSDNVAVESEVNHTEDPINLLNESNSTTNNSYITDSSELDGKENNLSHNDSKTFINLNSTSILRSDEDSLSKSSENSGDLLRANFSTDCVDKSRNVSRLSERAKKKSWYNVLYPNYKSRSQDFKKLFKEVPNDERLIVDYSCALYRDLLIQGRLYISQNYVCFHANILGWETCLNIKWKDVTSITKEKTALVIPNAISICTPKEKYFFSSFTTRDKTFLILFRVWQNTLMNKPMLAQEVWQLVHNYYGDELGLTTDDEDYIDPSREENQRDDSGGSILDFESAIDDANSVSLYKDVVETSNSNIYQIVDSSSGNSASNNNSENTSASSSSGGRNTHLKKIKTMKSNAKELTLISAKPDESSTSNSQANAASAAGGSSGGGNVGTGSSGASGASSLNATKESKQNSSTYDSKRKVSKNNRQRDESASKNSENFPTDNSDSSDSEETNIPFVSTAECNSLHEGRQLVHTILPINIETLFNFLFSKSKFLLDFHAMRKSTDLVFGDWITNEDGQKTRTVNVTVQLAASVGPKTSKVTEHQAMRDCTKPGELYSIDINSVNAGIPYADSFSVLMHYCLVKTVDDHTMLSVHAQIKYKKSIWGVVKGFIEKNTWAGLEDFYTSLLHSLQSETCIPPAKGKGRRPRRGTAAQIRPLEEMPILQAKPEPMEHFGAAQTLATRHLADSPVVVAETTTKYRWLSLFVLVLLCFLIIVNVILLLKLWKLEERIDEDMSSRARMPNLSALKQLPNNHEDWLELLRQQEILHETELKKWHTVLQTAIELLKKTERTLAELMFH